MTHWWVLSPFHHNAWPPTSHYDLLVGLSSPFHPRCQQKWPPMSHYDLLVAQWWVFFPFPHNTGKNDHQVFMTRWLVSSPIHPQCWQKWPPMSHCDSLVVLISFPPQRTALSTHNAGKNTTNESHNAMIMARWWVLSLSMMQPFHSWPLHPWHLTPFHPLSIHDL